ncbi:ATP-binding protein [[Pseudomonas] carboxydohydrogena]|uniref:histidine kinase n=2 Tax=Afipia carboxydohydrogena TaxID=290 RepID=A0ABY8BPW7_AFICR|nr:ATP-binding protein [[Pseudomonas] carboxydohydrogena]WEF52029.1 ATP-binding protein [[Pseudomonas] carboxydohydrogena]
MISIRRAALIWMTAVLTVVGVVAFIAAYVIAQQEAADFLDGQLRQIAINVGDSAILAPAPTEPQDPEDELVVEVWSHTGAILRRTPNAPSVPRLDAAGFATIEAGGVSWRVYQARDASRTVQIAQQMEVRREIAASAAIQAGIPILILIPLAWLVVGWSVGQLTGRLQRLAESIAGKSLDSRAPVPTVNVPTEIIPLVEAMNGLTNRLRDALDQQKRFVADAAHELRTPLTALQIQVDNLDARHNDADPASTTMLRDGLARARRLVEQLLRLARSDEPENASTREVIELSNVVTQCVADVITIAESKGVDLGIVQSEPVSIIGSRGDLALLFGNLIDNAVRYTGKGGVVNVSIRRLNGRFVVEVTDTGPGVAEADIPRLFDRFFRAAPLDVEGSGLGLAIAASVARSHGLQIEIINRPDRQGLIARVSGAAS